MTDTLIIRPASRSRVKAKILIAGPTGGGKTYSAILLARGIVGPSGRIGFLDTERGRGERCAGLAGGFDIAQLAPPYTPERYVEAIDQFERAGYDALIIDSISHEWEGDGGILEQAEAIEIRTRRPGLHCWAKPKGAHKKFVNKLLSTQMHLIICARAREKTVAGPKDERGKETIVSAGFQPIVEKNFPFEVDVSMMLDDATKVPTLRKCPADLLPAFPQGQRITIQGGALIGQWLAGGVAVDHIFIAAAEAGREAARRGSSALKEWWGSLTREQQVALTPIKDGELRSIAGAVDQMEAVVRQSFGDLPEADKPRPTAFDPLIDPKAKADADSLAAALREGQDLDQTTRIWADAATLRRQLEKQAPARFEELTKLYDERVEALT